MADVHSCRRHAEDMVERAHRFYFHIQTIWLNGQKHVSSLFFQKPGHLSTQCSMVNCLFQSYLMASSIWYLKIIFKVEKQCRLGIRTFWIFLVFWLVMRMLWRCILYVLAFHDKPAVAFLINEKWSSVRQWQTSYRRKKSVDKDVFVWTWTNNPMIEFFSGCFLKI